MNPAILRVSRKLALALVAMTLVSLSAHAGSPKAKDKKSYGNSTTEIAISVNEDTATVTSGKEISHVVIWYCDPQIQVKYEEDDLLPYLDWTGHEATFSGSPIMSIAAKSGTSSKVYLGQCPTDEVVEEDDEEIEDCPWGDC